MAESQVTTKVCRECGQALSFSAFNKHAQTKDRLRPECKECQSRYRKGYYSRRREELKKASRLYYEVNRDTQLTRAREYREANKEILKERGRRYRASHREVVRQRKAAYFQANKERVYLRRRNYVETNRDALAAYYRAYREDNRERRRAASRQYKARKRSAPGLCTPEQWIARLDFYGWACYLCRCPLESSGIHMEHRIPLSRGGSQWPANLAPACPPCNLAKGEKTEAEFRAASHLSR